jgi:hypothetical protein
LVALNADLAAHPEGWANSDLKSFIEAMAAWAEDMVGFYSNAGEDLSKHSPWRVMVDMLMAARMYE